MNFIIKIIFIIAGIFIIVACGVKNDPQNPQKHAYPSVIDEIHNKIRNNYYGDAEFDSSYR